MPSDDGPAGRRDPSRAASRLERRLWLVVLLGMAADVALTAYGRQAGLVELNPVAREVLLASGTPGLVAMKAGALAAGVGCRSLLPGRYTATVPACLAVPTVAAVLSNGVLVAVAVA